MIKKNNAFANRLKATAACSIGPSANESEDHDRFSTSAICHALLHPITLGVVASQLANRNADCMVPLRDSPETRSSCSRAFARPAPGCRSASSRPAASTARYCTSTSPVLAQSRPRRRRKSVRGLGASRACSKRPAHRATQAHECTPARAIADLILQTQSASRDNLAGLRSIDIPCLPRAAFQRPVGR